MRQVVCSMQYLLNNVCLLIFYRLILTHYIFIVLSVLDIFDLCYCFKVVYTLHIINHESKQSNLKVINKKQKLTYSQLSSFPWIRKNTLYNKIMHKQKNLIFLVTILGMLKGAGKIFQYSHDINDLIN